MTTSGVVGSHGPKRGWSPVLLALAGVGVVLVGLAVFVLRAVNLPPLRVKVNGRQAVIDVQTLGEYPTTIRLIEVTSKEDGVLLGLKGDANSRQIRTVTLSEGENSLKSTGLDRDGFQVLTPVGRESFVLRPGTRYRVRVANDWGSVSDRFTFDAR